MKTSIILIVVSFLLCCTYSSWGQESARVDSLLTEYGRQRNDTSKVKTLQNLFNWYIDTDWELAMKYNSEQLKLATQLDFKRGLGLAYMNAGVLANSSNKIDSGIIQYKKAQRIFNKIEHYALEAWAIKNIANSENEKGNYDEALNLLDKAFETFHKSKSDPDGLASFYGLKALIHFFKGNYKIATTEALKELKIVEDSESFDKAAALYLLAGLAKSQGDYHQAITYNLEAAEIYKKYNDKAYELQCLIAIGENYRSLENYSKAVEYLEDCLPVAEELKDLWFKQGVIHSLGVAYVKQHRLNEGIKLLKEGVELAKILGTEDKIMMSYNALGYAYSEKKDYLQAKYFYDKVITTIDTTNSKVVLSFAYFGRSGAYEKLKKYNLALEDFKTHKRLNDTVYNATKSQQIEELKTIYETEKKEQQIVFKENEIRVLEQEAEIDNLQKIALGGGFGLSIIALGFGFYGFRQRIKKEVTLKKKR